LARFSGVSATGPLVTSDVVIVALASVATDVAGITAAVADASLLAALVSAAPCALASAELPASRPLLIGDCAFVTGV
jgi:hypothetical protein